jgi:hypothetical protein
MDPLPATIEEFAVRGCTHVACASALVAVGSMFPVAA